MKRVIFLVFLLLLIMGCSSGNSQSEEYEVIYDGQTEHGQNTIEAESKNFTVAVIPKVSGIPYFNAAREGAMEAGRELGINVLYEGPLTADWKMQRELIDTFIEKEVDLIAISANDPEKLGPALTEAERKGIKVITWDSDTDPAYREVFVNMADPEVLGRHVMDTMASQIGEQGDYAILTGSDDAANTNEWVNWMKKHQAEYYPAMKLVEVRETDDEPNKAYMAATELLEEHPELKGIIGGSSVGPPAAAQAIKDKQKTGKVQVAGLSTPNLMREYIREGTVDIVTLWSPKRLGYLTVSAANHLLEGRELQDNQTLPNIGVVRVVEDVIIMGRPIDFTRENIDEYDF